MKLKKELNGLDVFSIAAGAMISSGLFVLPAIAIQTAGGGILYAYLFAGILMLPALFSQLELATAIPRAGGTYFFIERILGTTPGVIAGFANWFSISLKSAFALVGIGAFASLLFPGISDLQIKLIAAGACLLFTLANLISVKSSGKLQVVLVFFLLLILTQFVLFGYRVMDFSHFKHMENVDWRAVFATTGMVFISYGGLTKIASIAEEVKNPQKNLVRSAFGAFIIVQLLYLLVVAVLFGILPINQPWTLTPISTAARKLPFMHFEIAVTAAAAILAFITTANAGIMAASRVPMSMSRDELLPKFFGKMTSKQKTPYVAILLTSLFMLVIIITLDIKDLAKVASLFMILLFIMVNISVIVIRQSKIVNYKPTFKSPLYPVMQILGIIAYLFLILTMGLLTAIIAGAFILFAILWFFIYVKKRVKRKSAFVHMIQKITGKELAEQENCVELEKELLNILLERNDIVEDRFDSIIRQAEVLDLDKTMDRDEMFTVVSQIAAKKWSMDPISIKKKLIIREEETSTLIYPGVAVPHAIPHIIIEGSHTFDIILVRNKFGIKWNEQGEVVYTVFCLLGTKDERNFHLRALMAIAQILQDPGFHNEWMQARNIKELRSTILLTKRKRDN